MSYVPWLSTGTIECKSEYGKQKKIIPLQWYTGIYPMWVILNRKHSDLLKPLTINGSTCFYMLLHLYTHPLFPLTPASTFSMHWFRQTVELRTTTRGPGSNSLLCFDNIVIELNPGTLPLVSRDQCPKTLLYSNKDNNGQTAMLWSPISRTDPVQISVILTIIEINALFHSNKKKSTRMVNYNIRSTNKVFLINWLTCKLWILLVCVVIVFWSQCGSHCHLYCMNLHSNFDT